MKSLSELKNQNPLNIFQNWLKEATLNAPTKESATAFVFSNNHTTHWGSTHISSRVVLLKQIENNNLIFYTNYKSNKMKNFKFYLNTLTPSALKFYLNLMQPVALNFYWPYGPIQRQVRLEGIVKKTSSQKSNQYWKSRSKESQISQYISKQSSVLESLEELEKKWKTTRTFFLNKEVPRPKHWGGLVFTPMKIEFWEEKPHRLHQRLLFKKKIFSKTWTTQFLYP